MGGQGTVLEGTGRIWAVLGDLGKGLWVRCGQEAGVILGLKTLTQFIQKDRKQHESEASGLGVRKASQDCPGRQATSAPQMGDGRGPGCVLSLD